MTTTQPAALPELPEKLIFSERLAISEAAQVPMDAECCRVIQATLDYISSNYALAALQPQPAAAGVSDAEILHIVDTHVGEPTPRYPLKASDWINFARAILALRPQAVPMTDERIVALVLEANAAPAETPTQAMTWIVRAVEAHHGITQRADGGEG